MRVCRIDLAAVPPTMEVIHRVRHHPITGADGLMRWDWDRLVGETFDGLQAALRRGPVASIGVDTWGVDYGLLGDDGALVESPVSYRDGRTAGYRDVVERIGAERLYDITGTQLMPINTIFQLAAHDRAVLDRATRLLLLPELLVHHLTGVAVAETTSAGTTGLLDLSSGAWSAELLDEIEVDPALFAPPQPAGMRVGTWHDIPVHLVGGHDTASAVLGGGSPGATFISAGTWLLVGREQREPDRSPWARAHGLTNEQGALGGIRLLRNVVGFWLVEECRRQWGDPDVGELLDAAARVPPGAIADVTDERFLAPDDMAAELCAAAGIPADSPREVIVRCAIESMAESTVTLARLLDAEHLRLFGGGGQAGLLVEALERRSGLPVSVGPVEATALGNAVAQGIALGYFADVERARAAIAGVPR